MGDLLEILLHTFAHLGGFARESPLLTFGPPAVFSLTIAFFVEPPLSHSLFLFGGICAVIGLVLHFLNRE